MDGLHWGGRCSGSAEGESSIDNLLVQIHYIIETIWWTGLAPWELGISFLDSLASTFLVWQCSLHAFVRVAGSGVPRS